MKTDTSLDLLEKQLMDYFIVNNLVKQRNLPIRFAQDLKPLIKGYGDERERQSILQEGVKVHKLNVEMAALRQSISQRDKQIRDLFDVSKTLLRSMRRIKDKTTAAWIEESAITKQSEEDLDDLDVMEVDPINKD